MTRDQYGSRSWTRSPSMSHHTNSLRGAEDQKRSRSSRVNSRYPPCSDGRKVRIKGRFISSRLSGTLSKQSRRSSIQSANSHAPPSASRSFSHTGTQTRAECLWFTEKISHAAAQRRRGFVVAPLREKSS